MPRQSAASRVVVATAAFVAVMPKAENSDSACWRTNSGAKRGVPDQNAAIDSSESGDWAIGTDLPVTVRERSVQKKYVIDFDCLVAVTQRSKPVT